MNVRVQPSDHLVTMPAVTASVVTASYAPDFERCRLLCETIDRYLTGHSEHLILVEAGDVPLFRALQGGRRRVIDERELLPSWLRSFRDPFSFFRRRVWLSTRTPPLRGWHVQQLRRIAIAGQVSDDVLVYCDSDVAFLRPFDCAEFSVDGKTRLFRRDGAMAAADDEHRAWSRNAGVALGIATPDVSPHDYIATLIAWRRDSTLAMCRRIEAIAGKPWMEAVASVRRFSECTLYGRFVDEVDGGDGHVASDVEFCRVQWSGGEMDDAALEAFVRGMDPRQVAIGMQSFIGTDLSRIRRLISD